MQYSKHLGAAVKICVTLLNKQTYRQSLTGYTIRSASWAKSLQWVWI